MDRKVAVVLSGGGAKGAYEAGALKVITRRTRDISIITGASIGAINAAVFAAEYEQSGNLAQAAYSVEKAWEDIEPLFKINFWRTLFKMIISMPIKCKYTVKDFLGFESVVDNGNISKKINELIPDVKISDIKRVELSINATDLTNGKTVSFCRKNDSSLREAVLASSCIPMLFPTVEMDQSYYIDGGIFNNTPLSDALRLGATHVFVIDLNPKDKSTYMKMIADDKPFDSVYEVGSRFMELIFDKIMYEDLKKAKRTNNIINVIHQMEAKGNLLYANELKKAISYKKDGRTKAVVKFYEVAPSQRLDPPGTLGFDNKEAIVKIMNLGRSDAMSQLNGVYLN